MSAQHTPGPWTAESAARRRATFAVSRELNDGNAGVEFLPNKRGGRKLFRTAAAAHAAADKENHAAIAKATGSTA